MNGSGAGRGGRVSLNSELLEEEPGALDGVRCCWCIILGGLPIALEVHASGPLHADKEHINGHSGEWEGWLVVNV